MYKTELHRPVRAPICPPRFALLSASASTYSKDIKGSHGVYLDKVASLFSMWELSDSML